MSPSLLAPYKHRSFRVIASAAAFSLIGTSITSLAMPLYIIEVGGGAVLAGALATLRLIGGLIMPLIGGVLADRFPRRMLFIAADAIRLVCLVAILGAVSLGDGTISIVVIVIAVTVEGLVGTVLSPALPAAIRTSLDGADLQQGILAWQSLTISVMIVGPILGGVLLNVNHELPFLINAMTYAASLAIIFASKADFGGGTATPNQNLSASAMARQGGRSVLIVLTNPYLRVYGVVACLVNFTSGAALFLLPVVIAEEAADGAVLAGVAMSVFAVCGLLGTLAANWLRTERDRLMLCLYAGIIGACYVGIGIAGSLWALIAIMAVTALAFPILQIKMGTRFIEATPESQIGKAQGALAVVASAMYPFAGIAGGVILQNFGPWATFAILGIFTLVPLAFFWTRWFRLPSGDAAVDVLSHIDIDGFEAESKKSASQSEE